MLQSVGSGAVAGAGGAIVAVVVVVVVMVADRSCYNWTFIGRRSDGGMVCGLCSGGLWGGGFDADGSSGAIVAVVVVVMVADPELLQLDVHRKEI